jgi:hypothetical protein
MLDRNDVDNHLKSGPICGDVNNGFGCQTQMTFRIFGHDIGADDFVKDFMTEFW